MAASAASADPGHGAPPARVHAGQHVRDRVVEHDRHAVADQDGQHRARVAGDQRVGLPDGVLDAQRAAAALGRGHDLRPAAVDLPGEHEVSEVGADRGRDPLPVLEHGAGVVADAEAEVQRGIGSRRHAAVPGGHHDLGAAGGRRGGAGVALGGAGVALGGAGVAFGGAVAGRAVQRRPGQHAQAALLTQLARGRGRCGHARDLSRRAGAPRVRLARAQARLRSTAAGRARRVIIGAFWA